ADTGKFETMESIAPPVGRGWEFVTGTGWDWDQEIAEIPVLLAEKMKAPSVEAGNSFATFDKLGSLVYGSPHMHVTGDRTAEYGLSTIGYDDDGVAGQQWD